MLYSLHAAFLRFSQVVFVVQERLCQDDMTLKATTAALVEAMDAAVEEGSLDSWRTADTWEDRVRNPAKVCPAHRASNFVGRGTALYCAVTSLRN